MLDYKIIYIQLIKDGGENTWCEGDLGLSFFLMLLFDKATKRFVYACCLLLRDVVKADRRADWFWLSIYLIKSLNIVSNNMAVWVRPT